MCFSVYDEVCVSEFCLNTGITTLQNMDFLQLRGMGLLVQNHLAKRIRLPLIRLLTLRGQSQSHPPIQTSSFLNTVLSHKVFNFAYEIHLLQSSTCSVMIGIAEQVYSVLLLSFFFLEVIYHDLFTGSYHQLLIPPYGLDNC